MQHLSVDFHNLLGKPKPMHAANNFTIPRSGWDAKTSVYMADDFKALGIPYVRNHDASLSTTLGGHRVVDVDAIFPDMSKDPEKPENYDFAVTDEYVRTARAGGSEVFYRLGASIEHGVKKYRTLPPTDNEKYAIVCEHIVRHYNEGWADGFHENITYWEIWNEPNLDPEDSPNKKTWGGTKEQFFDLFVAIFKRLKTAFPHLKIGGPAHAGYDMPEWDEPFFGRLTEENIKLDFYSYHLYHYDVEEMNHATLHSRKLLDSHGQTQAEAIFNEWNYIKSWEGQEYRDSYTTIKNHKGAAFALSVMLDGCYLPVDMLMYYDLMPNAGFNGVFGSFGTKLKSYYVFSMYNELYQKDRYATVSSDHKDLHIAAATSENDAVILISNYSDEPETEELQFELNIKDFTSEKGVTLSYFLLDETNDFVPIRKEIYNSIEYTPILTLPKHACLMVKLEKSKDL